MSHEKKLQAKTEQLRGALKAATGQVTGNERLRREGKSERSKGTVRETTNDLTDSVRGTVRGWRGGKGSGDTRKDDERGD